MFKILGIIVCWVLRWCTPDLQKLPMYRLSRIVEVGDRGWRMDFSYHSMRYSLGGPPPSNSHYNG